MTTLDKTFFKVILVWKSICNQYLFVPQTLRSDLHEELRPSKCEANSHEILTQDKKGDSSNTTLKKHLKFSILVQPNSLPLGCVRFCLWCT